MPRTTRIAPGGMIFHCLNRRNERQELFADAADYAAFERILELTLEQVPVRLLSYCLIPNHWHLLLQPDGDGDLARFMHRLTTMHVRRWHQHRHSNGSGHLYQGTYKSFPVQDDRHFSTVARYVERNALRAGLVQRAEQWQWNSLWRRVAGTTEYRKILSDWPIRRRPDWIAWVNGEPRETELAEIRESLKRGRPFGDATWQNSTARQLNLHATFRPRGRPVKSRIGPK